MKNSSPAKRRFPRLLLLGLFVAGGGLALWWCGGIPIGYDGALPRSTATVLVFEDRDRDYSTAPFDDRIIRFGTDGHPQWTVTGFNLCETVGGCRAISVSGDGQYLVACENTGNRITAYDARTGRMRWSRPGGFTAAKIGRNGTTYALVSDGMIYGSAMVILDANGGVVREQSIGGFDLALDPERQVVWTVGKVIRRCDEALKVLQEVPVAGWAGVSIDLDSEGSAWVAERQHPDVAASTNRVIKISADGKVQASIGLDFSPLCVRVDPSDGAVWVTGSEPRPSVSGRCLDFIERRIGRLPLGKGIRDFLSQPSVWSRTERRDRTGALQVRIDRGGFSLDVNTANGSVWIAARDRLYHYARSGDSLGRSGARFPCQRYVVVAPVE